MTFLHWVGDTLREQFDRVPLPAARWILIGVLLVLLFWVVQLPSKMMIPKDRQSRWYEDLRIWAWIAVMVQILIYSIF